MSLLMFTFCVEGVVPPGVIVVKPTQVIDVALSVPSVVNLNGIKSLFDIPMSDKEIEALKASAVKIREVIDLVM